jgi:hypothetical protein
MENGNKNDILNMINEIEKKNLEIENYLSSLSILSRNETIKIIIEKIFENNSILQEIEKSKGEHQHSGVKEQVNKLQDLVDGFTIKIKDKPNKKIIYLREFLENFPSISNNDKDVIIKSLKDEQNLDILKKKMMSLVEIFL